MAFDEAYPRRKPVPWRVIDTETLVVDVKAGLLFPLNSVATRIWQLCDGEHSVDEIVRLVTAEFDADKQMVEEDATGFLRELLKRELILLDKKPERRQTNAPGTQTGG